MAGIGGDEALLLTPLPKNHQEQVPSVVPGTVSASLPFILPSQSWHLCVLALSKGGR